MVDRRALIVGINTYTAANELQACVADAKAMEEVLSRHKDGAKNFDCITLLDRMPSGSIIGRADLREFIIELFAFDGDVLLYFSGQGFLGKTSGLLCTSDVTKHDWGIPMKEIVDLTMQSPARQILLILDCCYSGDIANMTAAARSNSLAILR